MRKTLKKLLCTSLAFTLALSMVGCGNSKDKDVSSNKTKDFPTFDSIKLGEDYKDLKADIKVLTHRTDLTDNVFKDYIKEFNKLYPNIKVEYEGITNYSDDITTRLTTNDWGDVCMIPASIDKSELPNYFISFGDKKTLEKSYIMLNNESFDDQVYGIPSVGNAQGVIYNKKVFKDAGIKDLPKTPDEFIEALQKIKDNTKAIPMYTNFHAGWTMGAWDAYITGSATGDPDFANNGLVHGKNPFTKRDDGTGPYAVYSVLYDAVAKGLVEDDPTTSDWEGSKAMMNKGEIGTMVLGSWAVVQMQKAGKNANDIGYMPFPITIDGKQYASAGPDYTYGINKNISEDEQIASMLYVKWLTDESNFAYDQGGIPLQVGAKYPKVLSAFQDVTLVIDNPAPEGEEDYYNNVNNDSELGLNVDNAPDCEILEHALKKDKTLDQIMDEWNQKWTQGQEDNDIEITE